MIEGVCYFDTILHLYSGLILHPSYFWHYSYKHYYYYLHCYCYGYYARNRLSQLLLLEMNKDLPQLRLIFRKQMMLEGKSLIFNEYLGVAETGQETGTTIEAVCLYLIYL